MTPLLAADPAPMVEEPPRPLEDYLHALRIAAPRLAVRAEAVRRIVWGDDGATLPDDRFGYWETVRALEELVAQGSADYDVSGRYRARTPEPEPAPLPLPPSEPPAEHRWADDGGAQEPATGDPTLEWRQRLAELEAALPPRSVPDADPDAVHEQAVGDFVYLEPEVAPEPAAPVEAVDGAPLPAPRTIEDLARKWSCNPVGESMRWLLLSDTHLLPAPRTIDDLARKWSCNPVGEVLRAKGFVAEVATRREKLERAIAELTEARDIGIEALAELDRMMGSGAA